MPDPVPHRPLLTILVIAACVVVFFAVQPQDELGGAAFLYENAAISCEILGLEPLTTDEITTGRCGVGSDVAFPSKSIIGSVFASIFLHANLLHLVTNMWSLWIFGNNVEEAFGATGYLVNTATVDPAMGITDLDLSNNSSTDSSALELPLFCDGFESGTTAAWSSVFP